jgi:hypothetical protein
MAEADSRPLADVLFGSKASEPNPPDGELAEAISVWFRTCRAHLRDAARFGTPTAELQENPHRRP